MSNIVHSPSHLRKLKGQTLSRFDSEQKMLSSGPLGTERLIMNIALDFMEKHPHKLTKITKHAKRHFWLNDVCTCHGLLPSHSA